MIDLDPWAFQRWAYQTRVGSPARKAVLMVLAVMVDTNTGRCEAKQETLAQACETTDRTIRDHLLMLERSGIIARRQQRRGDGRRRADEFLLLAPWVAEWPDGTPVQQPLQPADSSGRQQPEDPSGWPAAQPEDPRTTNRKPASGQELPPKNYQDEGERERARANQGNPGEIGGRSEAEHAIAAELGALLADRGEQLTARDRLAIRSAVHATPVGVDPVAAAKRLRRNYGPDGKAANRRIRDVVAVLIAEIEQSTPTPEAGQSGARGRRRAAKSAGARETRLLKDLHGTGEPTTQLRVHQVRPAAIDPPTRHLQSIWDAVRPRLESPYTGLGHLIDSVALAGTITMLVENAGEGEDQQLIIVLEAPAEHLATVAARGCRITGMFEQALETQGVILEVAPRIAAAQPNAVVAA